MFALGRTDGSRLAEKILWLWKPLGLSKSLQQIEAESGYEEVECENEDVSVTHTHKQLRDPNAQALHDFLRSLIH